MYKTSSIIKNACIALGLTVSLNSCKVDILPTDRYSEGQIWANPSNMELYMNGMYSEFQTFSFGQFPIGYSNATDALTDIMKYTSTVSGNGTVNILASDPSRVNAAGPQLNYWQDAYTRVRRLNELIDGVYKYSSLSDTEKKRYEAEARFIRGYVYFWLARLHGSFVLMDEMSDYDTPQPRASEDDCWNFIANDFSFAAEHLPKEWDAARKGKATKGAAYGMLARTWLYAASVAEYDKKQYNSDPLTGVPESKARQYYQNAVNAAGEVRKLAEEGYYALETNFESIFTNPNTKEAIFKIDYVAPTFTHQYDLGFAPPSDAPGQCLVYGVPTAELVDAFQMADGQEFSWNNPTMAANPYVNREPRFYATILYNGAQWKGRTLNTTPGAQYDGIVTYGETTEPKRTVTGYYVRKMLNPVENNFVVNKSSQHWIELRYAEVVLIDAEAKIKTGDLIGAKAAIDELRSKRGLPATPATSANDLMAAVERERMVELAFEGHRYWDLRRWRKAHIVLNNKRFTGHSATPVAGGFRYDVVECDNTDRKFIPDLYYMPIIINETQNNTALEQIKGW